MKKKLPALVPSNALAAKLRPLVESFLSGRNPRTLEAYRQDLQDFARYLGARNIDEAARLFLASGKGQAHAQAFAYRAELLARGLAPASVNRRLAALRSLVKLARLFNMADFVLEVEGVKSQAYRDTRGPGREGVHAILDELEQRQGRKAKRDRALVRLLYDLGLRRGEAVALDLADVDLKEKTVSIIGKGRTEKEALTLPDPTAAALTDWLAVRGTEAGPLFTNCDRAAKGNRLTGRSVARVLAALGDLIGLKVRPHGLRHAAVTEALDVTGGNVRKVQKFSRHRDMRVLTLYDDNRQDFGGEVARLVAARV